MNSAYRLVWSKTPTTLGLVTLVSLIGTANATTFIDFTGGLSSWTTGGSVTLSSTTVTVPTGGATFTLTPAAGYEMARINAPNGGNLLSPNATLGLSASSLENFLNNPNGHITNFGLLTKSFNFNVGTYTFAWAYGAQDYQPFNDGAVFSLVGGGAQSLVSLARNGSSASDVSGPSPGTLILGSYGATPWLTASFDITTAGTYQVGFSVYNWNDQALAPNLYVSGIEGTYTGTPVQSSGGTPAIIGGTGGNVSASVFDTTSAAYAAPSLTFAGGTLQYTADTTTSKNATLTAAGGAIDTNGHHINYTGVISGSSNFYKVGAGALTLTNINTYTGVTQIDSGTLELSGNGSIAASSGIVNNGVLDVSAATTAPTITTLSGSGLVNLGSSNLTLSNASGTYDGSFTGTGSVNIGAGTLVLSGASTHTGGMNVLNGATLTLANNAALGDSVGGLTLDNSNLVNLQNISFNNNLTLIGSSSINTGTGASMTLGGVLSGTGNLTKTGAGSLVLAGDNTAYSQNIVINDGNLLVQNTNGLGNANVVLNAGSVSADTSVTLQGSLSVAPDTSISTAVGTSFVINGPIASVGTGNGCFEKVGAGTLVIAGVANIDSGTCVQDGMLYANGTLNSAVTVQADGVLRGSGLITRNMQVYGKLAPGRSPGTLQTTASVTMAAGSTYQEDINGTGTGTGPGNYSRLILTGASSQFVATGATLEPNLTHITGTDTYIPYVPKLGDAFRIITAEGGIVGEFDSVTQPDGLAANTRIEVYYDVGDSDSIDLFIVPTSYAAYVRGVGGNENAQSSAAALDTLMNAKAASTATEAQEALLYAVSTQTDSTLESMTTALAGEVHGALAASAPLANHWLVDSVGRQLSHSTEADVGQGIWVDVGANRSTWKSDSVASRFDTGRSQVAIGADAIASDSARIGLGLTHAKVDVQTAEGSGSVTHTIGFVYGQVYISRVVIEGMGALGSSDWETDRRDPVAPLTALRTDFGGYDKLVSVGLRLPLELGRLSLSPYARATWERVSREGFDEGSASLAALTSSDYQRSGTRMIAGLSGGSSDQNPVATRFAYQFNIGVGRDASDIARSSFGATLAGVSTTISSPDVGRTFVFGQLNATARLIGRSYGFAGISGETRSGKNEDLGANLGVRLAF